MNEAQNAHQQSQADQQFLASIKRKPPLNRSLSNGMADLAVETVIYTCVIRPVRIPPLAVPPFFRFNYEFEDQFLPDCAQRLSVDDV